MFSEASLNLVIFVLHLHDQMAPVIEMCEHFLIRITRQDVLLELLDIADHYLLVRSDLLRYNACSHVGPMPSVLKDVR